MKAINRQFTEEMQGYIQGIYKNILHLITNQWVIFPSISSVAQSYPTLCDPMNCSMPGLWVHHQLTESTQTHVHRVGDPIQPSHPLSSLSPPAHNPSQHQGLFQWVNSLHEVPKVLEFQLQHHSFQRNPRADLLQNGLVGPPCSPGSCQFLLFIYDVPILPVQYFSFPAYSGMGMSRVFKVLRFHGF